MSSPKVNDSNARAHLFHKHHSLDGCPECAVAPAEPCECGHLESDHRSIPPYHCQNGMAEGKPLCECSTFTEENKGRLNAEYEAQRYEDQRERYR